MTFSYLDEEKRFLLTLFTDDQPFVTSFVVVLVDADLIFFLILNTFNTWSI